MTKKRHWTVAEDKELKQIYADTSTDQIAKHFNRNIRAVHNRAAKLGLRKSHRFIRWLNTTISRSRFTTSIALQSDCRTPHQSLLS